MSSHTIAKQIEDAAEAYASRIDDLIKANDAVRESVKAAVLDLANIIGSELDERSNALALIAAAIRNGTAMMPPATQLVTVGYADADAVVDDRQAAA